MTTTLSMITTMKPTIEKTEQGMSLSGSLVFANITALLEKGSAIVSQHLKRQNNEAFIVDCKNISRIDSAGMALLLEWQRQCKSNKSICHFVDLPSQTQSLIQAYKLQSLLKAA